MLAWHLRRMRRSCTPRPRGSSGARRPSHSLVHALIKGHRVDAIRGARHTGSASPLTVADLRVADLVGAVMLVYPRGAEASQVIACPRRGRGLTQGNPRSHRAGFPGARRDRRPAVAVLLALRERLLARALTVPGTQTVSTHEPISSGHPCPNSHAMAGRYPKPSGAQVSWRRHHGSGSIRECSRHIRPVDRALHPRKAPSRSIRAALVALPPRIGARAGQEPGSHAVRPQ